MNRQQKKSIIFCLCCSSIFLLGAREGCPDRPLPDVKLCLSDSECIEGQFCDLENFCDSNPACRRGDLCSDVCHGHCVSDLQPCMEDGDCNQGFHCELSGPTRCDSTSSIVKCMPSAGTCVADPVCPKYMPPLCEDGELVDQGVDSNGCQRPPLCKKQCDGLGKEECAANPDCRLIYLGMPCHCTNCEDINSSDCACNCPQPDAVCVPKEPVATTCRDSSQCADGEFCDTTNFCDPAPGCDIESACNAICYGRCQPKITCPTFAPPRCEDGELVDQGFDANGCRLPPICVDKCEALPLEQCESNPECVILEVAVACLCDSSFVGCNCPPSYKVCATRPPVTSCLDNSQCAAGQICDTTNFCDPGDLLNCTSSDGRNCIQQCHGRCVDQTVCPMWMPAPPLCDNGILVDQGLDANGCPLPPICVDTCGALPLEQCESNPECTILEVTVACLCDSSYVGCDCPPSHKICANKPPATNCLDSSQCAEDQICDTTNFCDPNPSCSPGQICNHVCYGRCIKEPVMCPMIQIDPDFCLNGEIIPQGLDSNGCAIPPVCKPKCSGLGYDECKRNAECVLIPTPCVCTQCNVASPIDCFCECPNNGYTCVNK